MGLYHKEHLTHSIIKALKHMDVYPEIAKSKGARSIGTPDPGSVKAILLVDESIDTKLLTKWFFGYVGYVVHAFSNAEDALAKFDPDIHDLVVTDNWMSGMTGVEMAHIIKMRSPSTPVLMYTESTFADQSCVDAVVKRPTLLPFLKEAVDKLLAAPR
jgi:CheY-like chemotaxis protein